jgi:hypothetical protein
MGQNWGGGNYLGTWYIHVFRDINISIQIVSILDTNVCKAWAQSDKNWQFWKNDLDLNIVSMMIGSKVMPTFVKNEFVFFVTLTWVQFLPNVWCTMRSTRWNKLKKNGHNFAIIFDTMIHVDVIENIWYYGGMNVDVIDKQMPLLYNGPNCCHGNKRHIQFHFECLVIEQCIRLINNTCIL